MPFHGGHLLSFDVRVLSISGAVLAHKLFPSFGCAQPMGTESAQKSAVRAVQQSSLPTTTLQPDVPLARPCLTDDEVAAAVEVLRSGQLCLGEKTARFEELIAESIGVSSAVCVASGSAALLVAMQALGVKVGDEVIVPDVTFVTTATAAMYLGATPVFCDISADNHCIDPVKLESRITGRTKLIVPVHLGGRVADMQAIKAIADTHGIPLLEDAAGALGSSLSGHRAGSFGDAAIFSFTPTKVVTTGEGGVITTNDEQLAERCRKIRNFGDDGKFAWNTLGFNFRMTELSAAIGIEQIRSLDSNIAQRQHIARNYNEAFCHVPGITVPALADREITNFQQYPIQLDVAQLAITRDEVIEQLARRRVASRVYYPALHNMPVFAGVDPGSDQDYPIACRYEQTSLCLPIFAGMTDAEQRQVIESLRQIVADAHLQNGGNR